MSHYYVLGQVIYCYCELIKIAAFLVTTFKIIGDQIQVIYRKKLLRHVLPRIDDNNSSSEIVGSVDIFQAIW